MKRDGGGKPGRAGRQITVEEAELWHQLSRSVDKVKIKPRIATHASADAASASAPVPSPARPLRPANPATRPMPAPAASPPVRASAPAELDRRALRQVAAGKVPIDAVLDLHGLSQHAAHTRLRAFLMSSHAKGHRMVLIVTGKGAGRSSEPWSGEGTMGGSQRGVLRRSVPLWLDEPDLRSMVLSYAAAGVRHGGEGALYVRLRKARGV